MPHFGWTKLDKKLDLDQIPSSNGFQHSQRVLFFPPTFFFFFWNLSPIFSLVWQVKKKSVIVPSGEVGVWVLAVGKLETTVLQCVSSVGSLLWLDEGVRPKVHLAHEIFAPTSLQLGKSKYYCILGMRDQKQFISKGHVWCDQAKWVGTKLHLVHEIFVLTILQLRNPKYLCILCMRDQK